MHRCGFLVMQISLHTTDLTILRKAVSGLSSEEIARELDMTPKMVSKSLKDMMHTTKSKDPYNAMQTLAKQGFTLLDHSA